MRLTATIAWTDKNFHVMAKMLARSIHRHNDDVDVRIVRVKDKGRDKNFQTRFAAYHADSDWVLAVDADTICYAKLLPLVERAEANGHDFVGRISRRYQRKKHPFRQRVYSKVWKAAGLPERKLLVPNIYLVRGELSKRLADRAMYWSQWVEGFGAKVSNISHGLADQVGFTLAVQEVCKSQSTFILRKEVADGNQCQPTDCPALVHYGAKRYMKLLAEGRLPENRPQGRNQ